MSYIGATGLTEYEERFDTIEEEIDSNATYINTLVGIPDPIHLATFGINVFNPSLYGLVERAEVNISALQVGEDGLSTDLSALTTQVEGIQTEVTSIQGEITALEGQITAVEGSISVIDGDLLFLNTFTLPAMVSATSAAAVLAGDALVKANKSLSIWDESGDNVYHKKVGNVGIGTTFGSVLTNKLEVGGNINIPTGSKYKINNVDLSYNDLTNKLTQGTNISIVNNVINNTYELPTATSTTLGSVRPDNSTITISNGILSAAAGATQVNSDWTQTNTSLKSFIQNKPSAGNNISFANNSITNTITGSPTQNIIGLNTNQLIVVDKPNSEKIDEVFVPLTNEPYISSPAFTESIRTFTHSGGTETQTTYDITIPQNTICDILMIGGGGGGGKDRAGGGGAGALILSIGNILSGTYNIRVGNKGLGATTAANGQNGYDCEIYKSDGTIIFRAKGGGGGQSLNAVNVSDGGCGGGKTSQFTGLGGIAVSTNVVNGITTGPVITTTYGVYGNVGGRNTTPYVSPNLNNLDGAGGGGIGEGGSTSGTTLVPVDNQFVVNNGGKGGDGLYFATINGTTYNFKNYFNVNGVQDGTTGNFFIGGGGGGGDYGVGSSGASGKGGGGVGGEQTTTGANATGFGSGGGGGGGDNYNGGNGSAGIIVIKLRTIVNSAIPEGNPITHKTLNFTYVPPLVYDFTSYNTYASWTAYATSIGATYSLNGGFSGAGDNGVYFSGSTIGFIQLVLPNTYNFMSISFGNAWTSSEVRLLVNGIIKATSPINGTTTYSQAYIAGDILKIEEVQATIDGDLKITLSNTNQYTLSVPLTGTGVIINNTTLQYLSAGTYTISVGATQSSVVIAGIGQVGSDPYPATNGSTIAFKYSMTQRTQTTTYYKKDGLIKYVPASGTNPSTGTWQMIDVDSQALTQFAGNLPFTRIDGNVPLTRIEGNVSGKIPISSTDGNLPASRIDNLALSLGMDLTGVNGATQIKLTSAIVVVQGNLYSTGVNYFKYNVWHLDSDGFERFYFQQSNTTYLKGHGTTPFDFRNGANTNICTISGGGGLAVASYLQGAGAGGGFRLVRPDTWVRMKSTDETIHLNFAAQNLYAHGTLDAQGIINLNNFTYVRMQSIANTGNELVCVVGNDAQGEYYNKVLYIAYGTFTGFHRCYVEDELCNDENVDIFKNEYIGRVVISTGKIKTDASRKKEGEENEHEWYSLEGKEGITIEDALPIIQLSRVRKDKRVYGVLGDPKRGTNNNSRIIVNGCGEGSICVANTNGNIENGDYIQTSDLLGYGEKQDDDIHRNYTIAKAVMDCTFELDNPNYECKELSSSVRVAMIACVYKAS